MVASATMKEGKRLRFDAFGKPEGALRCESFALPQATENTARVRILAAPINPADLNTIEGTYGHKPDLPATPGIEGHGVVEDCPCGTFQSGDRVIFLKRADTWASHTLVSVSSIFRVPDEIDPLQAAMLKVNPATAWRLLHGFENLAAGDWVVQNLGNSAVGRCVIQLCRELGYRCVSFVRRECQIDQLSALGADHVFVDDENGASAAKEILQGANASVAFNAVGGDSALRLMKLLRESGTHVTYGAMGRKPITLPNGLLIFRDIRIRGLWVTKWVDSAPPNEVGEVYQKLADLVSKGKVVQPVDRSFPLDDWKDALARLDEPDRAGKVLFRMD